MEQIQELGSYARQLGCEVKYAEPMSLHTTFQIGGPADLFLRVYSLAALQKVLCRAGKLEIPFLPLGNGSNTLFSDKGFRGAVLVLDGDFKKTAQSGETEITCGTAVSVARLCSFARDRSLTGIEFAWGIPGLVGGAAFMNAGAYGHTVSEVVTACSHVTPQGDAGTLQGKDLRFGYRHSAYTDNGCMITSVRVRLAHGDRDAIETQMKELYARRKSKQPLEMPSAGSVFKRPVGHFAGTLIEQCGLKGRRVGGAMVSEKHAGFIVNSGGATCEDVRRLIALIQETVFRETGVRLECEVKMIG